jgi:hypothetical protein
MADRSNVELSHGCQSSAKLVDGPDEEHAGLSSQQLLGQPQNTNLMQNSIFSDRQPQSKDFAN